MTLKRLYFFLKWKEGLSPFQIGPPFLCFENGMFNTMKSLSPAPSFSVMGSELQRGALFMGRFMCAGMRTKAGRKLALECHAGDDRGRAFHKPRQGTGARVSPTGLSLEEAARQGRKHQRNLKIVIKQTSSAPWMLLSYAVFQFL